MARRLVQSEITRFNGVVTVEAGQLVREETGRIAVYDYRSQEDARASPSDRVTPPPAVLRPVTPPTRDRAAEVYARKMWEAEHQPYIAPPRPW